MHGWSDYTRRTSTSIPERAAGGRRRGCEAATSEGPSQILKGESAEALESFCLFLL